MKYSREPGGEGIPTKKITHKSDEEWNKKNLKKILKKN